MFPHYEKISVFNYVEDHFLFQGRHARLYAQNFTKYYADKKHYTRKKILD